MDSLFVNLARPRPGARLLRGLVFGGVSIQLLACGEVQLPPPSAPQKVLPQPPEVPSDPVPQGGGRVVLDANGEQARVVEVAGATVQSHGYSLNLVAQRPVCASTPCVVDLPRGPHRFVFLSKTDEGRGSDVEIDVGARPRVIRHAMGERVEHMGLKAGSATALTLGVLGACVGGSVLLAGAIASSGSSTSDSGASVVTAGGATLGISAAVIALGITLGILGRTEVRKGSTTEWPLDGIGNEGVPRGTTTTTTTHVRLAPSASGLGLSF